MRFVEISNLERGLFSNNSVIQAGYAYSPRFFVSERLFTRIFDSNDLHDRFLAFEDELREPTEEDNHIYYHAEVHGY